MTYATDGAVIRQRWESLWAASGSPVIASCYEDMESQFEPAADQPYVRLAVRTGTELQVAMGKTRLFRRVGVIEVGIRVPVGSGDGLPREVADRVAAIFRGRTVSGIVCRACSLERVGTVGAHVFWECTVPYHSDENVPNPN